MNILVPSYGTGANQNKRKSLSSDLVNTNSGAPRLSKSTHPRKFGNHVTVHRPPTDRPSAPQENQCLLSHIYLVWEPKRELIVHQCCDQSTAIKTGHPLTSITWPYRGLKCRPIEVEYFLKLSADKLPVSNDRRLKFTFSKDSYQICCVYVTMPPHY